MAAETDYRSANAGPAKQSIFLREPKPTYGVRGSGGDPVAQRMARMARMLLN